MRVVTVVGARPQFIKAATVSRALRAIRGITEVLVHTGQHYSENMSAVFFDELEIRQPDHELGVGSGAHGAQTGQMLAAVESVLMDERPELVVVYGDTNSTLAGALAAAKLHIPIAHVEAGLRSFNRRMPEEINRILTDHVSTLLFAPTKTAVHHLIDEGISDEAIHCVGDVMYDAALYYAAKAEADHHAWSERGLEEKQYVLATIHRAENTDDAGRLTAIVDGLARVARDMPVVLPVHPRTREALQRNALAERVAASLTVVPPASYLEMIVLERSASIIATDSGGVQKEAYFYRVPCVTLRDETEWVELVEIGANRLCPPHSGKAIEQAVRGSMCDGFPDDAGVGLYGDGNAANQIARIMSKSIRGKDGTDRSA